MNPIELFHADGRAAGIWYCEKCRIVAKEKAIAEACCVPLICSCGSPAEPHWTTCVQCRNRKSEEAERKRFEAAEKLTPDQWDGPILIDSDGDDYRDNVQDYISDSEDGFDTDGNPIPEYVWTCDEIPFVTVDIEDVDRTYDGKSPSEFCYDDLKGREELKISLEAYNNANKNAVCWEPNFKRCVVLPKHQ